MSEEPSESMVFDTGVLIEIVRGSKPVLTLKTRLESGTLTPHTTEVNLFEISYLVCRREGWAKAKTVVNSIRESGYFKVHEAQEFLEAAARTKCDLMLRGLGFYPFGQCFDIVSCDGTTIFKA